MVTQFLGLNLPELCLHLLVVKFLTKGFIASDIINKILNNFPTVYTITYFIWLFLTGSNDRCQVHTTHVPISEGNGMGGQNNMFFLVL